MASKTVTISIDDKTDVILGKIKSLRTNRSGLICDLLAFYADNDYRIPIVDDEDIAEIRREQGLDDDESVLD